MTNWRPVFVLIIALGLAGCDAQSRESKGESAVTSGPVDNSNTVKLHVDFPELKEDISCESAWQDNMTVLDLLLEASAKNNFVVDYTGQGEMAFVDAIDGMEGGKDGRKWWIYFVNNKMSPEGSGVCELQPGDQVRWQMGIYEQLP